MFYFVFYRSFVILPVIKKKKKTMVKHTDKFRLLVIESADFVLVGVMKTALATPSGTCRSQ